MRRSPFSCRLLAYLLIAAALPASTAEENRLGRLFFTPERRLALDQQRRQNWQNYRETLSAPPRLTLDGIVRRSSGRHTAWINGNAIDERNASGDLNFAPHPRMSDDRVEIRTGGGRQTLRVGDRLDHDSGEKETLLPAGQIRIRPARER